MGQQWESDSFFILNRHSETTLNTVDTYDYIKIQKIELKNVTRHSLFLKNNNKQQFICILSNQMMWIYDFRPRL